MVRLVIFISVLWFSFADAAQSACGEAMLRQMNSISAQNNKRVTSLKRTGDCLLLPTILAADDRFMAICFARASQFAHCGAWCRRSKSRTQVERELRRYCKTKPSTATAQKPSAEKENTSKEEKAKAAPAPAPTKEAARKAASCSDITGTGGPPAPNDSDCKEAKKAESFAQQAAKLGEKEKAAKGYRQAAEAYRRAGDSAGELAMLRAAAQAADKPARTEAQLANVREAETYVSAARAIEANDATCAGLRQAAENYYRAGQAYFRNIDSSITDLETNEDHLKTNEMLRKRDALNDHVDRLEQEGRCGRPRVAEAPKAPGPAGTEDKGPTDCQAGLEALAQLRKSADALKSAGSIQSGASGDDPQAKSIRIEADIMTVELAAQGCRDPNAGPPSELTCMRASLRWTLKGTERDEIDKRLKAANCPS